MNNSEVGGREDFASRGQEIPEKEYTRRLNERQHQLAGMRALHRRWWIDLVLAAVASIVIAFAALGAHVVSTRWILLPAAVSVSIVQALTRNARAHARVQRIVTFYELGLGRLRHRWQGHGLSGEEFRPENHAYASDLDLFGAGSLFELLCTARTGIGRAKLADWLLKPAETWEVAERQLAITELRDKLDLREGWASAEGSALERDGSTVREWASAPVLAFPSYARVVAVFLPVCLIIASIAAGFGVFGHNRLSVVTVPLVLEALLAACLLRKTRSVAADLVSASFELSLLAPLLGQLENEQFQCPWLRSLQSQLTTASVRPSLQIRRLSLWSWLLGLRQIEYFALLSAPILWGTNLAMLIEVWRQQNRQGLLRWLDSLAQFEALLCLARYSYENPDHTFATLESQSSPLFHAEALGHPLLNRQTCVRCDLHLDGEATQLVMVSGSNMSGKSTLLRSVGINSVLAFAGAPVRAARLQISPLQIGCSIRVHDSLLRSRSRFQAEVERLKWILDLACTSKVLFLMDEVLGGTNSNDRLFGATAVIGQLAEKGAIGMVTTHDLALTRVVDSLDGRAINVHFEEHYENGRMLFDYQMRLGVLTRTNGLNVMAALGLLPQTGGLR
ncbi:MAG: hypothetical protein WAK29_17130 [Terriglobales bacterium]